LERKGCFFDQAFLETQLNQLTSWIDQPAAVKAVQVLPVKGYRGFEKLNIAFDQNRGKTTAYFSK
jgi:hypothetical protein